MPNMNLKKLLRRKKSVTISDYDPTYKVIYLGNVLTGWAKGDGCVEKPLSTLWRNYCQSNRPDIPMKVTICGAGLRAVTIEHGLTEYWSHRVTYCTSHPSYPRVFCWIYRHEGRRLKQELRCHAVLCPKHDKAEAMTSQLKVRLSAALHEFRREKQSTQNARLSLVHAIYDSASLPRRKLLLSTGSSNYRPPLERSKSAPKLGAIEESVEEEEEEEENIIVEQLEELEEVEELEENTVLFGPIAEGDSTTTVSETTSDIVTDFDSCSEAASACTELSLVGKDEYDDGEEEHCQVQFSTTSDLNSLLYCPLPPSTRNHHIPPLSETLLVTSSPNGVHITNSSSQNDDLTLLRKLTIRDLVHNNEQTEESLTSDQPEESLTSDQPESLGSQCESCNSSSCGECDAVVSNEVNEDETNFLSERRRHNILVLAGDSPPNKGNNNNEEGDNISEESGYSEDKEALLQLDAAKVVVI